MNGLWILQFDEANFSFIESSFLNALLNFSDREICVGKKKKADINLSVGFGVGISYISSYSVRFLSASSQDIELAHKIHIRTLVDGAS